MTSDDDLRAWLGTLEKNVLADWLLDAAQRDGRLRERLHRLASLAARKMPDAAFYRDAIDAAAATDGYVSYREVNALVDAVNEGIRPLHDLLAAGLAPLVIELAEHALKRVEQALEHADDSDGRIGCILQELQDLHLAACRVARPDPEALAARLFEWEVTDPWSVFDAAVESYADVLGETGLAVYRARAEVEWNALPVLSPGATPDYSPRRASLSRIMETFARRAGEVDVWVNVLKKDLSRPYCFARIAILYRDARRFDDAVEWAERGVRAFPTEADSTLADLLAAEYHRRGRHQEAIELAWRQFDVRPGVQTYHALKAHAQQSGPAAWSEYRERALALLRRRAANPTGGIGYCSPTAVRSVLVEILLDENDVEAAWTESQRGACDMGVRLRLAERRVKDRPLDALAIYEEHVQMLIERKKNREYAAATHFLVRMRTLCSERGLLAHWHALHARLSLQHKAKRNFMALLARL